MDKQEAATIIDTIVNSLRKNPNQFQFQVNVNMTGLSGTAQGGGIGVMGVSQGGGTGISSSASMDNTKIEFAQKKASDAMHQEIQALLETLSSMSQELRSQSPNESKLTNMFNSLKKKWIPGVIISVVGNLLSMFFQTTFA